MAQTLPQRKLLLSIIFDPMHRLPSNMTQNDRKNNAKISNKKNATPGACIMHKCMHLCAFVTIYALNVINFVQNYLFEHSLVCFCPPINAQVQYLHTCIKKCACMHMHMHMQMHNTKTNYLHYGLMGCHFRKQSIHNAIA